MPRPRSGLLVLALVCATRPLAAQPGVLTGTVQYEKIPATRSGLRLSQPVLAPAAGIRVEALPAAGGAALAAAFTDTAGRYRLQVPARGRIRVRVRALAATENAPVVSVNGRRPFAITSPELTLLPGQTLQHDLLARDADRSSGPFNIARTLERANALIRSVQPSVQIPTVEVRWDTSYVGGTFFRSREKVAFINGRRGQDSDEFDDHVIIHEYGHFLMATLSQESSPGGDHRVGELLDPRLAWSEGWADFFAAAVTGDPLYVDTGARRGRQLVLVETDLEEDVHHEDRPGIWSEHSVGSFLWDLYDAAVEPSDSVTLGFAPLWTVFSDSLRKQPDPYLITFVDALARHGAPVGRLRQLLAARSIGYPETPERFALALRPGVPVVGTVDSRSTRRSNLRHSSAHYWFVLAQPRQVTVSMKITSARNAARADLDLILFDAKGNEVGRSDAVNGVGDGEQISRRLEPGYYRAEVRSWSGGTDSRLGDANAHEGDYRLVLQY